MTKKELRKIYKEKRYELSVHNIEKFNDLILVHFQKSNLPFLNCIHTYLPSLQQVEPDTFRIIRYLEFKNPSLKVGIPKINIHSLSMEHYYFDQDVELIKNSFGIDEPKEGHKISETEIDMILIPLLAFDRKGYRVGYGKGYYDRFLSKCRRDVIKFGLSFFEPVDEIDDISSFDIPLSFCATPHQLYSF